MNLLKKTRFLRILTPVLLGCLLSLSAQATTVRVQTSEGDFIINLFDFTDSGVEETVANFLAYVNSGRYDSTYFHRLSKGFVIQGGGYVYDGTFPTPQDTAELMLTEVELVPGEDNPTVDNQPMYSNVRGTVAMAKIGNDPNSATNQWFVSLADNAPNLDLQNGGFTVFGIVTEGMDVVEALADYTLLSTPAEPEEGVRYVYPSPLDELPLTGYTQENFVMDVIPDSTNLAFVMSVSVMDSNTETARDLDIIENELVVFGGNPQPRPPAPKFKDNGAVGWLGLLTLILLVGLRRLQTNYRAQ